MSFFQTTEFYVILFLVAMAIVAFMAIPHHTAPASEYLLAGRLSNSASSNSSDNSDNSDTSDQSDESELSDLSELSDSPDPAIPGIDVDCDDSGTVWLRRTGLRCVDATGAVSAKVIVKGFNITVYERIVEGRYGDNPMDTALFELDFLAAERYWLRYESESTTSAATLSFRNTPGYHAQANLKQ